MTKRNVLVLCGLVAAYGLQAGETQGWGRYIWEGAKATPSAIGSGIYSGWEGAKAVPYAGAPFRGAGWLASSGYDLTGRGLSAGWQGLKATPGATWGAIKATPGAIGSGLSSGYDLTGRGLSAGWQGLKATPGAAWGAIKATPGAVAGYATHPYVSEQYPITGNLAAALAAAATAGALYKGGQYAADWYNGPLDSQILNLIRQENVQDISDSTRKNIHNKLGNLLAQKAEQLANAVPKEALERKIQRLETFIENNPYLYPSNFANDTFKWYVYNVAINLLKNMLSTIDLEKTRFNILTQAQAKTTPKEKKDALYKQVDALEKSVDQINRTINRLSRKQNELKAPETTQSNGYFGWLRRK